MTTITDPRAAGQLARYDVLRAAVAAPVAGHEQALEPVVGPVVERLLAEYGPVAVAALVVDLAHEAATHYRHHAVALASPLAGEIADALEGAWGRATSATLRYLDEGEADERRAAERDVRHEAADGALTAA